ncbi:MAG: TraX family protein, partial [Enterococcus faecalis]|nr:conjugal transfer protein TraX [Enterococcus faecalis]MDU3446768.1 TraX family protein [Enterococcus faecalis]
MNANRLKLLMMGLMVLDHISYFVPPEWALIFHVITRCVGVFFGYMAVEGFNYTRNVYRYNGRLYIWAAIMFVGNTLLNHLVNNPAVAVHNNIFFTLALGVSMLIVTKAMLEMPKISLKIVLLISILAILGIGAMFAEGGIVMLPFMLITYLARKRLVLRNCLYGALALFFLVTSFQWLGDWPTTIEMLAYNSDFMFITVLPFISLYNGERGSKAPFFKYLFYGFYPLHLWLIA